MATAKKKPAPVKKTVMKPAFKPPSKSGVHQLRSFLAKTAETTPVKPKKKA